MLVMLLLYMFIEVPSIYIVYVRPMLEYNSVILGGRVVA